MRLLATITIDEIVVQRLHTQRLAGEPIAAPEAVLEHLGAMQSQEFGNAKWPVGQRATGCHSSGVQAAFDSGRILPTHLLRPTWLFVSPAGIRWMLQLTAGHGKRLNGTLYRKLELDDAVLAQSRKILTTARAGRKQGARRELETFLR